ncbi:MAG: hypothetical protein WCE63_23305 [Acidobacteriaceae bacterium]
MDYSSHFELPKLRRERRQAEKLRPIVARQCICPNAGQADAEGYIRTSPACEVHRPHRPWGGVPIARLPTPEEKAEVEAAIVAKRQADILRQKQKRERLARMR